MRTWFLVVAAIGLGCGSQARDQPDANCSRERCDGKDNNCDGQVDEGFDLGRPCSAGVGACRTEGVTVCLADGEGTMCSAQPGAPTAERCNGIDDNCDGRVDEGFGLGAMCTTGTGGCVRAGTIVCDLATGEATCSAPPGPATAEVCNGVDDNCDGQVDEGFGVGAPCEVGVGACRATGAIVCDGAGGTRCDAVAGAPSEERCNGIDDDCDGAVDDLPGLGGACTAPAPGICAQGILVCSDHGPVCAPGTPQPEICNGLDDNCNGQVDEGFATGESCDVGVGACLRTGVTVCDGPLATRCTATPGEPSPETCNGTDDDCNGTTDDVAGLGDPCQAGALGICAQGHLACGSGALVCVPGTPQPEICNGVDDSCDGQVDETDPQLGLSCATGQPGACSPGTFVCATGGHLVCQPQSAPSSERCNGIDDDCNGQVDDGCLPDPPQARFPWNGLQTGSPWLPAGSAAAPLRPRFLWSAVAGAERYEIEVDDSCPAAFRGCAFPSPEIRASVTTSSFQPDAPLAVALTPPVGRRYYWHVRACTGTQCSVFTEVRYVDVGRVAGDVNGDGYPDLLVQGISGPFALYPGGATGLPTAPAITVSPPPSGVPDAPNRFQTMHVVGDVNGDGFADVCVPYGNTSAAGGRLLISGVALYHGGPGGLPDQPSATLPSPLPASPDFFGPCYGVGDVNGDGQDDLIVSGNIADTVLLYPGSTAGVAAVPSALLADPGPPPGFFRVFNPAARLGDIDGDGYPDFAISAVNEPPAGPVQGFLGAVYVYRGGPAGPATTPSQVLRNAVDPSFVRFGRVVEGNRDLDGDGLADAVIAPDPMPDDPFHDPGHPNAIYVYRGSTGGLVEPPLQTIRSPRPFGDGFASALALGDANGDGAVDLVSGDPEFGQPNSLGSLGIAELYLGAGGHLGPSVALTISNPLPPPNFQGLFGFQVALCDLDADGFDDRVISAPDQPIPLTPGAVYVYPGSPLPTGTPELTIVPPFPFSGNNFGWVLSCGQ